MTKQKAKYKSDQIGQRAQLKYDPKVNIEIASYNVYFATLYIDVPDD